MKFIYDRGKPFPLLETYWWDLGFYYIAFWAKHNKKGFATGNPSNIKIWKDEYFYLYDVLRINTQFNLKPRK